MHREGRRANVGLRAKVLRRRHQIWTAAIAAMAASIPAVRRAQGSPDNWQTLIGSGNWNTAGNWTGGIPTNGADVFIVHNDATNRVVTYDYTGTNSFLS